MRYTDAPLRRSEVMRRLTAAGYVSSARLGSELGVSEMTVRRDLRRLESEGLAARVAGGAVLPGAVAPVEPFDERTTHDVPEKRAIARAAVALLGSGGSVALDAGTTVAEVVGHLPPGMTVTSHSLAVLTACADRGDLDVIGLGGSYQPVTRSFAGPATRAAIEHLSVDTALLSAVAAGPQGLYCTSPLDAETKQLLAGCARRVVVLVDHGKLTARAPLRFATWPGVDVVVTDAGVDDEALEMLRGLVPEVVVAGTAPAVAPPVGTAAGAGPA